MATETLSKSEQVAQALIKGESLSAADVVARWEVSNSLLATVKIKLEKQGYKLVSEKGDDGVVRWRLAREGERARRATRAKTATKRKATRGAVKTTAKRKVTRAKTNGSSANGNRSNGNRANGRSAAAPPASLPMLGDTLTVVGLLIDAPNLIVRDSNGVEYRASVTTL